jgi:hypothetical protein
LESARVAASIRRAACPGFYDNGAYGDWKGGRSFDVARFRHEVARMLDEDKRPDFLVAPDVVAGGGQSLCLSAEWLPQLAHVAPVYLAVQDGMSEADVEPHARTFAGLFVGGTLPWKIATAPAWIALAHRLGRPCHVARVGTAKRVRWAKRIGADSIDSSLPLWSRENLAVFLGALGARQLEMPW